MQDIKPGLIGNERSLTMGSKGDTYRIDKAIIGQYYNFDPNNKLDQLILRKVRESEKNYNKSIEYSCRRILAKRFKSRCDLNRLNVTKIDNEIENRIQSKCELYNKDRDAVVREAFLVHFNIKMEALNVNS